jgi:hypothetical protein
LDCISVSNDGKSAVKCTGGTKLLPADTAESAYAKEHWVVIG